MWSVPVLDLWHALYCTSLDRRIALLKWERNLITRLATGKTYDELHAAEEE
jgi:hypothetical protein